MSAPVVWYCIPSANPERCIRAFEAWKAQGYKCAVLLDKPQHEVPNANLVVRVDKYEGYFASVNRLAKLVVAEHDADIVVTGGDDMLPDPNKRAEEIGAEFLAHFPDGHGVMQPVGDDLYGTDRICGSPWMGRRWVLEGYRGLGCFWPEYMAFGGDEELRYVADALGVLWQRPDLVQRHDHWTRRGKASQTSYQRKNDALYWERDTGMCKSRGEYGWPGARMTPTSPSVEASQLVLVTVLHLVRTEQRLSELRGCLESNVRLGAFKRVVVVVENQDANVALWRQSYAYEYVGNMLQAGLIEVVERPTRPTFRELFTAAIPSPGDIVVAANADIEFDDTVRLLNGVDYRMDSGGFYTRMASITRRNIAHDGSEPLEGCGRMGSHDVWAFAHPVAKFDSDVLIGVDGCDSKVNQNAIDAGLDVQNPCLSIRAIHRHADPSQRNSKMLDGSCYWGQRLAEVQPCFIDKLWAGTVTR